MLQDILFIGMRHPVIGVLQGLEQYWNQTQALQIHLLQME